MSDCRILVSARQQHQEQLEQFLNNLDIEIESQQTNAGKIEIYTDFTPLNHAYDLMSAIKSAQFEATLNISDVSIQEEDCTITIHQGDEGMKATEITSSMQLQISELEAVLEFSQQAKNIQALQDWLKDRIHNIRQSGALH